MSNRTTCVLGMLFLALLLPALSARSAPAGERDAVIARAQTATRVLADIMQAPDKSLSRDLLRDAYAIAVIPDVLKVGFVFGGRHGDGLLSVKSPDGTWSNPVFLSLTGGSVGFQAGVSSTDVVLVFRTPRGVDGIVNGKFTIGADAHAAAGPVGRNLNASTDAAMQAEIYSYSRSRGLFAGVSLDGAALRMDEDADAAIYGSGITPRHVFASEVGAVPAAVVHFRDELEEYTAQ